MHNRHRRQLAWAFPSKRMMRKLRNVLLRSVRFRESRCPSLTGAVFAVFAVSLCSLSETPECPVFLASGTTAVIVVPRADRANLQATTYLPQPLTHASDAHTQLRESNRAVG